MKGQRYRYRTSANPFPCPICGHDQFKAGLLIPILGMRPLFCSECTGAQFLVKLPNPIDE